MDTDIQLVLEKRNNIVSNIKAIIIEVLNLSLTAEEMDPDAPLFGTGIELDSIDAVELVVSIEKNFDIKFQETANIYSFRTINKIADAIYTTKEEQNNE